MNLREAGIQQSFDVGDVEHRCCWSVTCHDDDVQLLSFGIVIGPFYPVIRDRQTRTIPMQQALRLVIAAFALIALAQFSSSASAQSEAKQVKLTEKHIEAFIAAQKDMESFAEKLQGARPEKPTPRLRPDA